MIPFDIEADLDLMALHASWDGLVEKFGLLRQAAAGLSTVSVVDTADEAHLVVQAFGKTVRMELLADRPQGSERFVGQVVCSLIDMTDEIPPARFLTFQLKDTGETEFVTGDARIVFVGQAHSPKAAGLVVENVMLTAASQRSAKLPNAA